MKYRHQFAQKCIGPIICAFAQMSCFWVLFVHLRGHFSAPIICAFAQISVSLLCALH